MDISNGEVTVWLDEDGETLDFFPVATPLAKWTITLPEGARLTSCRHRGILIEEADGDLMGPSSVMACAKVKSFGYDIIDGYDPENRLEDIEE